jgi:hypothetical protein
MRVSHSVVLFGANQIEFGPMAPSRAFIDGLNQVKGWRITGSQFELLDDE